MSCALLPPELLDAVCQSLQPDALANLALSCTAFTAVAHRQLYRHIALSSHAKNLAALHTLAARPHLAPLVRTFALSLDDADANVEQYCTILSSVLRGMSELTALELHIGSDSSWVLTGSPPDVCYPRLESFASSFALDAHVASFLTRTPHLRSLSVSPVVPDAAMHLPSTAIPHLNTYSGPASLLALLLPARPIVSLHLSGDLSAADIEQLANASRLSRLSAEDDTSSCAHRSHALQVLSAVTSTPPVVVLEALANACPHLACLRIMSTCAFWEAPDLTLYTRIASTLCSFPDLAVFELSGMHWESRPRTIPALSPDGTPSEKEWISPPVTPRTLEQDDIDFDRQDEDLTFEESFLEWAY
ncbi:hypothetical protein K474DRAFT_1682465 [Panus rudis PR-1116 ss-1]|nr:hypothetical protein K474DRAFT_1682465 [Panus rudis PR-1116 ss-1]